MTTCPITIPDRYKIKSETGGGQGLIFICDDINLDRNVAIKCQKDIKQLHRLIDEVSALQTIRSKHVVEIYDLIIDANNAAIIMEYISGQELAEYNFKDSPPLIKIKVLYQIACGISDIHSYGHIHRDIKPHNMKIDDEGIVKILDFGLSREEDINDNTIGFKGTRGFAAPELYTTGQVKFSPAIDVYAFSASVWFMAINGLPPELIKMPPATLSSSTLRDNCNLPAPLADLIDTGLATFPQNRPEMYVIRDALKMYLLEGQHQGMAHWKGQVFRINAKQKTIKIGNLNSLKIHYDGLRFLAKDVVGSVLINNTPVTENLQLPQSCVITVGTYPNASHITFDISHPEVVL